MRGRAPPKSAQAALRALRLLKRFTPERPEMLLGDISRFAGLNKTTHRLPGALASEAPIDRNPLTGAYRLGPGRMALGVRALSSNDLRRRMRPLLRQLTADSGETATLEAPVESSMLILDEITGQHVVGASGNVGTRRPMHRTSTGKALLAFVDDGIARLDARLPRLTARTIVNRDDLDGQLADIRRQAFAETVDELEDGFSGVATVVRGADADAVAALSICGPTQRMPRSRRALLGQGLRAAASSL